MFSKGVPLAVEFWLLDWDIEKSDVRTKNESSHHLQYKNGHNDHMRRKPHGFRTNTPPRQKQMMNPTQIEWMTL
jgi:hypothetical protein